MSKGIEDPEQTRFSANRRWEPRMVGDQYAESARPADLLQERKALLRRVSHFNHLVDLQADGLAEEARLSESAIPDLESGIRKLKITLHEKRNRIHALASPAGGAILFTSVARLLSLSTEFELMLAVAGAFFGYLIAAREGKL